MTANNYHAIGELDGVIDDQMDVTAELMMARSIIDRALAKSQEASTRLESWKFRHLDSIKAALHLKKASA